MCHSRRVSPCHPSRLPAVIREIEGDRRETRRERRLDEAADPCSAWWRRVAPQRHAVEAVGVGSSGCCGNRSFACHRQTIRQVFREVATRRWSPRRTGSPAWEPRLLIWRGLTMGAASTQPATGPSSGHRTACGPGTSPSRRRTSIAQARRHGRRLQYDSAPEPCSRRPDPRARGARALRRRERRDHPTTNRGLPDVRDGDFDVTWNIAWVRAFSSDSATPMSRRAALGCSRRSESF